MKLASTTCLLALLAGLSFQSVGHAQEKAETAAPAKPVEKSAEKPAAESTKDYVILKVNGESIKKSEVITVWTALFPEGSAPNFDRFEENVRENVLRGVISEHILHKQAQASGIENSPEIQQQLTKLKEKLVTQAYLEKKAADAVTEDKIRKAYDQMVKEMSGKEEVRARHILVDTEDKAEEIEEKLSDDEDFEDLAKSMSNDKATAVSGGDLGFFTEDQMVPEFSHAAFKLKKGEVSKPVKTDFGWHIIKIEDRRAVTLPTYSQAHDKIAEGLKQEALKEYIAGLMDSASIEYFGPDGKKKELTKAPDNTKSAE